MYERSSHSRPIPPHLRARLPGQPANPFSLEYITHYCILTLQYVCVSDILTFESFIFTLSVPIYTTEQPHDHHSDIHPERGPGF